MAERKDMPKEQHFATRKDVPLPPPDPEKEVYTFEKGSNVSTPKKNKSANVVSIAAVNVREGPSKETKILYSVPKGTKLVALSPLTEEWVHVRRGVEEDDDGYVMTVFIGGE